MIFLGFFNPPYFQEKICFQGSEILPSQTLLVREPHVHLFLFSISDVPPWTSIWPTYHHHRRRCCRCLRFDTNAAATGEGIFATTTGDSWKIGADAALKLVSPAVGSKSEAADWRIDILIARFLTPIVSPLLLFGLPSI